MSDDSERTLHDLELVLSWFTEVLDRRLQHYFPPTESPAANAPDPHVPLPDLGDSTSPWARFVAERQPSWLEHLALALALAAYLRPRLLDVFFTKNATFDRRFTEFGGARTDDELEPTGETLAFVASGDDLDGKLAVSKLLDASHWLVADDVLRLGGRDTSVLKSTLRLSPEWTTILTTGRRPRPAPSAEFPAQLLSTDLDWRDLVLHPGTLHQLQDIQTFITHGAILMRDWKMASRLRPGHRALFHGPPGTGKTLTAALLGKGPERDVYRIDLSLVVSKYIGETEKNLGRIFDRAQRRDWILFFDEADALFGKRTETKDAHDRYANQEVSYLLQRIETFDGVAILASNMRDNLDPAFARRFESVIYFPLPRPAERLELWRRGFSPRARVDASVDLHALAERYELAGGSIMNVIRDVSLRAIAEGQRPITDADLSQAIRRELAKDGRQG